MIRVKNVIKRYDDHTALDHVNLQVDKGVILGLLGPNGAGKTTLVSILNGLTAYQEGEIEIFGLPLMQNRNEIRRRSSFIPQSLALYDKLSVYENLRFFAGIQRIDSNDVKRNLEYAISVNRLGPVLEKTASTLSGGLKQRLNIAIGLLNDPELLYFDEPTAGIDPELRNDILQTIKSFKKEGKTIVYTSHYMEEIEKICDQVAIINHGRIVREGSLTTLLQEEKSDAAVLELLHAGKTRLAAIAGKIEDVDIVDGSTLLLHKADARRLSTLLVHLESETITVRKIRFGATNLESLFLRLTSNHRADV